MASALQVEQGLFGPGLQFEVILSLIKPAWINLFRDVSKIFKSCIWTQHLKKPSFFRQSLAKFDFSWSINEVKQDKTQPDLNICVFLVGRMGLFDFTLLFSWSRFENRSTSNSMLSDYFKITLFGIGTPKLWQKELSWRWTFFQTWDQLKGSVLCNRNFRNMHWIPVGASLFASNIGSEHFIGINNHTNQSALTQPTSLSRLGWFRSCIWSRDRLLWNERHLHPNDSWMVNLNMPFSFSCGSLRCPWDLSC